MRGGVGDEGEEGGGAEDEGGVDGRRGWGRADSHLRCLFASTWAAPRDEATAVSSTVLGRSCRSPSGAGPLDQIAPLKYIIHVGLWKLHRPESEFPRRWL